MDTKLTKLTVQEARDAGFIVEVEHLRVVRGLLSRYYNRIVNTPVELSAKGGQTVVRVINRYGEETIGKATCLDTDAYNRKLGVRIALGRAMKAQMRLLTT